jgi:hypothetical protein
MDANGHDRIHAALPGRTRRWRRRIEILRLSRAGKPVFCLVSHDLGGGTPVHIEHLAAQLEQAGVLVLLLRCSSSGRVSIVTKGHGWIENLLYDLPGDGSQLLKDLLRIRPAHFHFHSNINIPEEVCALPSGCDARYDCTVHDYSWFCPRVHLVDETRVYCKEPRIEACEQCVSISGATPQWQLPGTRGRVVGELCERSAAMLSGARRVFCPSEDARRRITSHFNLSNAIVRAHSEPFAPPDWTPPLPAPGERLRVGVLGAIGVEKGAEVLQRCAYDAWKRGLPLAFIVIGYTNDDDGFRELPNVRLTGPYSAGGLPALLNFHKPHLCFFPAVWPETFSYTFSVALQCGLFPLAFDLGAIADRIRTSGFGELLPLDLSVEPERINERLLACGAALSSMAKPRVPQVRYPDILSDYYGFASSADLRGQRRLSYGLNRPSSSQG